MLLGRVSKFLTSSAVFPSYFLTLDAGGDGDGVSRADFFFRIAFCRGGGLALGLRLALSMPLDFLFGPPRGIGDRTMCELATGNAMI